MILKLTLLLMLLASPAFADTSLATYTCSSTFNPITADSTNWTIVTGEANDIDSNDTVAGKCNVPTGTGGDSAVYYTGGVTFNNDQYAQGVGTVTSTSAGSGICFLTRAQVGADTYYRNCWSHAASDNVTCSKVVAGVHTACAGWPRTQAFTDGATLKFTTTGTSTTTLKVYLNAVQVGGDSTDSVLPITGGNPGIGVSTNITAGTFDDLDFGTVTAAVNKAGPLTGGNILNKSLIGGGLVQ